MKTLTDTGLQTTYSTLYIEALLWHAMNHLRMSERRDKQHSQDEAANTVLYKAIEQVRL